MTARPGLLHLFRNRRDSCGNNDLPCHTDGYRGLMDAITTMSDNAVALSDDDLVERVKDLAARERRASVSLLRPLVSQPWDRAQPDPARAVRTAE